MSKINNMKKVNVITGQNKIAANKHTKILESLSLSSDE